jgi:hypothetical protein
LTLGDQGLTIIPANKDPWLLYRVPELNKTSTLVGEAAVIAAICLTVFALVFATRPLHAEYRFVPFLLLSALMLVAAMAAVSRFAVHPDEHVHVQAGEYYRQHNLPPPVGQAPVASYSDYGVSRLHSGEIAYFFAGKFAWVLQVFHVPGYLSLRAFNVALLFVLLLLAVNSREFRVLLVPLLLSPQIWYIFSYFNSEAYALFIVLLVAYQMAAPASAFNRLLGEDPLPGRAWLTFAGLGLLFGLLLLLKLNFYFYCLFLFLYFVWRILFGQTVFDRRVFVRLGLVAAIGLSVFAGVRGGDLWLNDFDKSARLLEAREVRRGHVQAEHTARQQAHPSADEGPRQAAHALHSPRPLGGEVLPYRFRGVRVYLDQRPVCLLRLRPHCRSAAPLHCERDRGGARRPGRDHSAGDYRRLRAGPDGGGLLPRLDRGFPGSGPLFPAHCRYAVDLFLPRRTAPDPSLGCAPAALAVPALAL